MARRIYTDGNWKVPHAISQLVGSAPFAELGDHRTYVYTQDYVQLNEHFKPLELGTRHSNGAYLVEESERRDIGGGAVQWTRTWAKVPRRQITSGETVGIHSEDIAGTVYVYVNASIATAYIDFYYAPDETWQDIPCYQAGRTVTLNGTTFVIPTKFINASGKAFTTISSKPVPLGSNRSIAQDSALDRWFGPIWKRTTLTIPTINLADAIANG